MLKALVDTDDSDEEPNGAMSEGLMTGWDAVRLGHRTVVAVRRGEEEEEEEDSIDSLLTDNHEHGSPAEYPAEVGERQPKLSGRDSGLGSMSSEDIPGTEVERDFSAERVSTPKRLMFFELLRKNDRKAVEQMLGKMRLMPVAELVTTLGHCALLIVPQLNTPQFTAHRTPHRRSTTHHTAAQHLSALHNVGLS